MPNERKIQIVEDLKEKLSKAQGVVLTDYQGLSVPEVEALRQSLQEVEADYQIVKNTLLNLALKDSNLQPPTSNLQPVGPTAVVLSRKDEIEPLKTLYDFVKEHKALEVKGGFFEGIWLAAERLKEIASLPSREVLLAKVVGMLQSPIARLMNAGKSIQLNLVLSLKAKAKNNPVTQ
jgi:large subunit ribosomal protein L10